MNPEDTGISGKKPKALRLAVVLTVLATPVMLIGAMAVRQFGTSATPQPPLPHKQKMKPANVTYGDLAGEFEHHEAMLICWIGKFKDEENPKKAEYDASGNATILQCIAAVRDKIKVVVLTSTESRRRHLESHLKLAGISRQSVRVVRVRYNSGWIRDYGPFSMRNSRNGTWLTPERFTDFDTRPMDWELSEHLVEKLRVPHQRVPFALDGGNLLSNGKGLLITSTRTLTENKDFYGYSRSKVDSLFREYFGAKQIVYLERMNEEATGHVDMFATFTAYDTIVLGEYDNADDPENRAVLERNRKRLETLEVDGRPLKVVRIPMPPRGSTIFGGSYTNVVFANGVLLVPQFADIDPVGQAKAVAVYQRLLPDWKVMSVDSSAWIVMGGSLHCLTKNVYRLSQPPGAKAKFGQPFDAPIPSDAWPTKSPPDTTNDTRRIRSDPSTGF